MSPLVEAMTWCRQATSHCLNQCWPSCMLPYDVTRPHLVDMPDMNLIVQNFIANVFLVLCTIPPIEIYPYNFLRLCCCLRKHVEFRWSIISTCWWSTGCILQTLIQSRYHCLLVLVIEEEVPSNFSHPKALACLISILHCKKLDSFWKQ